MKKTAFFITIFVTSLFLSASKAEAQAAPAITGVTAVTAGNIEKYAKFEVKFNVSSSVANLNPYYPFDSTSHPTWISSWQNVGLTGISVDMLLLPPGKTTWVDDPCFYYQPVEEVGTGSYVALLPVGPVLPQRQYEFRCRYAPEDVGGFQYKIRATDNGGTYESAIQQFTAVVPSPTSPTRHGFIRVSQTDKRFFEFSDGTPFVWPLVTSNVGGDISSIRADTQKLGTNGIHFIRWFPTEEDGVIVPYAGDLKTAWGYGPDWMKVDDVDITQGNKFSLSPYYYTHQNVTLKSGSYKLSFRASVTGERAFQAEVQGVTTGQIICATSNSQYSGCQTKKDGWNPYEINFTESGNPSEVTLWMHGLFAVNDGPSPFNSVRNGTVRLSNMVLRRDETGAGGWGPNLLSRGDPDSYRYVDQVQAAKLDEVLKQSEQFGVYHKWTVFHKNDSVLNAFRPDGTAIEIWGNEFAANKEKFFFSAPGQVVRWLDEAYERYFIARWSYSTAIHSLEIGNEIDYNSWSTNAALTMAHYFKINSSRHILMTTSFFGYWGGQYFYNADIDYGDKHWYADHRTTYKDGNGVTHPVDCVNDPDSCEPVSNYWTDSAAKTRLCTTKFNDYYTWYGGLNKPIVNGETGVCVSGVNDQDPAVITETTGTYYHKELWANVGTVGFSCDGEWWPWFWGSGGAYPNATYDSFKIYKAYDAFISGETSLNNGTHVGIGTDNLIIGTTSCTSGNNCITNTNSSSLRAFGSKDPVTSRVLVWVDNKNNTWTTNPGGATVQSGSFSISGMPNGFYTKETWNTRLGTYSTAANTVNVTNGTLSFTSDSTGTDIAYKFYLPGVVVPSNTPVPTVTSPPLLTPTRTPTPNPACPSGPLGNLNCDSGGLVNETDLSIFLNKWTTTGSVPTPGLNQYTADLNGDGKVDEIDLARLLNNWKTQ